MLVNRRTFIVKAGRAEEVVAMVKAEMEAYEGYSGEYRIYTPETGEFDVVSVEWEYESIEDYYEGWQDWMNRPETATFMEKWQTLTDRGGTNQLWWKV